MRTWLKEIREDKHMTQNEMSEFLNIPVTTYASYEQGKRTPRVDDAKSLGHKLKLDWTIFFDENVLEMSTKE